MAITHYVKAAISEYTDKTGVTKKKYQTIGIVMDTKHGKMLKLETIPLFALKEGSLLCYLNEPEEKAPNDGVVSRDVTLGNIDSDVPF